MNTIPSEPSCSTIKDTVNYEINQFTSTEQDPFELPKGPEVSKFKKEADKDPVSLNSSNSNIEDEFEQIKMQL